MTDALKNIMTRTSVRKYTGDSIPLEDRDLILKAAMAAPTAKNSQPWSFVVIDDKTILNRLREELPYAKMLDKADFAIAVCGIPDKAPEVTQYMWVQDCSAATQNILLAAHALGYGAVWTGAYPSPDRIKTISDNCGLPESIIPLNLIALGVPESKEHKIINKYDSTLVHYNKW
ncbi:nitroreductase family protein [Spirochaeta cellobiosiphila]|uniref:nitroreductase family protein n=1 Tax=Spirochaeta cellobiosiphila TaxID=504483 RepID=UPI0003F6FAB3|nr:nitroreductase family protein [Spirochaeta cellobiosiphila]